MEAVQPGHRHLIFNEVHNKEGIERFFSIRGNHESLVELLATAMMNNESLENIVIDAVAYVNVGKVLPTELAECGLHPEPLTGKESEPY